MSELDDLDQCFTSAGAAMAFALDRWDEFCSFMPGVTGAPVPISRQDMQRHAVQVMALADPERMPHS